MSTSKVILITAILMMFGLPQQICGQELPPIMEEVKTLCIDTRTAIGRRDRNSVIECKNKVENFFQKYDNTVCTLKLSAVDPNQVEIDTTKMRLILDADYLTYLLKNDPAFSGLGYSGGSLNRGAPGSLGIAHKGIPAKSTAKYSVQGCSNNMKLVVIVAEAEKINLSVTSELYDGDGTMVEQKVEPSSELGVLVHLWRMPAGNGTAILNIENPNDEIVTCVIALQ